jgi:hypothetical protein
MCYENIINFNLLPLHTALKIQGRVHIVFAKFSVSSLDLQKRRGGCSFSVLLHFIKFLKFPMSVLNTPPPPPPSMCIYVWKIHYETFTCDTYVPRQAKMEAAKNISFQSFLIFIFYNFGLIGKPPPGLSEANCVSFKDSNVT